MDDEEAPQGLTIQLSQDLFTQREVRAPSESATSTINTLDVVFIDNTGKVVTVVQDANGDLNKRVFHYGLNPQSGNVKWKNNNPATAPLQYTGADARDSEAMLTKMQILVYNVD